MSEQGRVGIGWRRELAADLLADREAVDLVEVVAETCFTQGRTRREVSALAELWPVVPHGVKLSLGSADGVDLDRVRRLGALARELRAPVVTEHVAFTRGRDLEIGHLMQLPRTRAAVRVVARNVARARRYLPDVPLLLENVAWSARWPDDEMDEAQFHAEVARATGCGLLLDVGNLYANALNERRDPLAVLAAYPLERVEMVHLAGGVLEHGFYFDTHADPVPEAVFSLLAELLARRPGVPVVLERDAAFGPWPVLRAELERARALGATAPLHEVASRPSEPAVVATPATGADALEERELADAQQVFARLVTAIEPPAGELAARLGPVALARARGILQRKRVDDALPLLERLSLHAERLRPIAIRAIEAAPRTRQAAGPSDAWRIAEAAAGDGVLRDDALVDRLVLRARFHGPDRGGMLRPRVAPFAGTERLSGDRRLVAIKGLGALATVRLHERRTAWSRSSQRSPSPSPGGSRS